MKAKLTVKIATALLLLSTFNHPLSTVFAQGTAFTYQGRLSNSNNPANGTYDFTFQLWNSLTGGGQVGSTFQTNGIVISNGLFTVTLDFGPVYNGTIYYLELAVRTNGAATFTNLSPRQELTPAPYAVTAENVDGAVAASQLTGTLPSGVLSGTYGDALTLNNAANAISGNGSGLTSLNGSQITTGTISDARLQPDVAYLDSNQVFTASNTFVRNSGPSTLIVSSALTIVPIATNFFTGLGFQYDASSGEGAIMSSYNDGYGYLTFYTKQGSGYPILEQMMIDKYGGVAIDQQGANNGVINNGNTNGAGLTFGIASGEGIASKQTAGGNQYGLDFYTEYTNRVAITKTGQVGINTTNPAAQLHVIKTSPSGGFDNFDGGPGIISDVSTGDGIFSTTGDIGGYGVFGYNNTGGGVGVIGSSGGAGIGVQGTSSSGTGVLASSSSGSALTIANGAIHVTGAGTNSSTAAFIQVAVSTNTAGSVTFINNPICNGDPNAILIVTPNYNINSAYWNHPVGVFYETTGTYAGRWSIVNEDGAAMTAGPGFNVLIIKN